MNLLIFDSLRSCMRSNSEVRGVSSAGRGWASQTDKRCPFYIECPNKTSVIATRAQFFFQPITEIKAKILEVCSAEDERLIQLCSRKFSEFHTGDNGVVFTVVTGTETLGRHKITREERQWTKSGNPMEQNSLALTAVQKPCIFCPIVVQSPSHQ